MQCTLHLRKTLVCEIQNAAQRCLKGHDIGEDATLTKAANQADFFGRHLPCCSIQRIVSEAFPSRTSPPTGSLNKGWQVRFRELQSVRGYAEFRLRLS